MNLSCASRARTCFASRIRPGEFDCIRARLATRAGMDDKIGGVKLICLPWAGGSSRLYAPWARFTWAQSGVEPVSYEGCVFRSQRTCSRHLLGVRVEFEGCYEPCVKGVVSI